MSLIFVTDAIILQHIIKKYDGVTAVNDVCLAVAERESMCLLGFSDAGKTTILSILTGDTLMTEGEAFVMGCSVRRKLRQVRASIGYCPCADRLPGNLTGRENLIFFGRLRGVPEHQLLDVVKNKINNLHLRPFADTLTSEYSHINKKKLSVAIAVIGNPRVILLNEPTMGVDHETKEAIWTVVNSVKDRQATILVATHSMEECEALSSRTAILVGGQIKAMGTLDNLKEKYVVGYEVVVQEDDTATDPVNISYVEAEIKEKLPEASTVEKRPAYLRLHVRDLSKSIKWCTIFEFMNRLQSSFAFHSYKVYQKTVEQFYLSLARGVKESYLTPSAPDVSIPEKKKWRRLIATKTAPAILLTRMD